MSVDTVKKTFEYLQQRLPMLHQHMQGFDHGISTYTGDLEIDLLVAEDGQVVAYVSQMYAYTDEEYASPAQHDHDCPTTPENAAKRVIDTVRRLRPDVVGGIDAFLAACGEEKKPRYTLLGATNFRSHNGSMLTTGIVVKAVAYTAEEAKSLTTAEMMEECGGLALWIDLTTGQAATDV